MSEQPRDPETGRFLSPAEETRAARTRDIQAAFEALAAKEEERQQKQQRREETPQQRRDREEQEKLSRGDFLRQVLGLNKEE